MTNLTVSEALRLIELARETYEDAKPFTRQHCTDAGCDAFEKLSRASYGALLEYLRSALVGFRGHDKLAPSSHLAVALAPLVAWADREKPGWRTR